MELTVEIIALSVAVFGVMVLMAFAEHLREKVRYEKSLSEINDIINKCEVKRIERKFKFKSQRGFDSARGKIVAKP